MRAALYTGVATALMMGSAWAGPQTPPAGYPTVSAGPAIPSQFARPTFGTPFRGYGGYRIGQDGKFHGYGVFAQAQSAGRAGAAQAASRVRPTGFAPSAVAPGTVDGEVLASSILANQYAPAYGALNVGYGGYGGY